jgi:hypothetical protein
MQSDNKHQSELGDEADNQMEQTPHVPEKKVFKPSVTS